MTAKLKLVKSLSSLEVMKLYAAHLRSQSWCIDSSGATVMALHASSGYPANLDHFKNTFAAWAKSSGNYVDSDNYQGFLTSLRFALPTMLDSILGSTMRPTPEPFITVNGATFANTYVPYKPPRPLNCTAPLAEELLDRLFPIESEREWVLQHLAHTVQRPLDRPQHGLLITGAPATCKSSLMRLVSLAMNGKHFYSSNGYTQALQKHSEVLPNNLVVVFDDATATTDTYEKLKDTITRKVQSVELKGSQKLVTREVYSRVVVISNSRRPLRLVDDRRFFAPAYCEHETSKEDSEEFGSRLADWLTEDGTPAILHHWLMGVDLTGFKVSGCPRTETLIQMEGASTPALERHIKGFIESRTAADELSPVFHEKAIAEYVNDAGLKRISTDEIAYKLVSMGYEHKRRRDPDQVKKDGDKDLYVYVWQLAGVKKSRDLSDSDKAQLAKDRGITLTF